MKLKEQVKKFQAGGPAPMPQEQGAPAPAAGPEQGGNSLDQLLQMADEALQSGNCDVAMAVCQGFMQLAQASAGGGAEAAAPAGEPVYRRGGQLVKRIKG